MELEFLDTLLNEWQCGSRHLCSETTNEKGLETVTFPGL